MSLKLVRVRESETPAIDRFVDRTLFQTSAWLSFVAETQHAEPVHALVKAGTSIVGRFTGLVVRRFGLRILGSPMPGWTTSYMGFNLDSDVSRADALVALEQFAFRQLNCVHFEVMDRLFDPVTITDAGYAFKLQRGFEIDLHTSEVDLFEAMEPACRRCIRKADKSGVLLEIASDDGFIDEYYAQLKDVFRKQNLVPTYPKARVHALVKHLLPTGNLLLVRARHPDGTSIATGIFPAFHNTMFFWGGASWRAHQHLRPNEAVQWFAMRYWKQRGVARYDMVGGGEYKRKYGGNEIGVPWVRKSKYGALEHLRNATRKAFALRQQLLGLRRS
jgi:hypothetical protein